MQKEESGEQVSAVTRWYRAPANVIQVVALLIALLGWYQQCQQKKVAVEANAILREELSRERDRIRRLSQPEVYIDVFGQPKTNRLQISVSNTGAADADSVWVTQDYYLVTDSFVYQAELPRFAYYVYDGSYRRMFSLPSDSTLNLRYDLSCWSPYASCLRADFGGQLVTHVRVDYNKAGSFRRQSIHRYCAHINNSLTALKSLDDFTGGAFLQERIEEYENGGPKYFLEYCRQTQQYFQQIPAQFYTDSLDQVYAVLPGSSRPRMFKDYVNRVPRPKLDTSRTESYVAVIWDCNRSVAQSVAYSDQPIIVESDH